jgi:hypothetical protein
MPVMDFKENHIRIALKINPLHLLSVLFPV